MPIIQALLDKLPLDMRDLQARLQRMQMEHKPLLQMLNLRSPEVVICQLCHAQERLTVEIRRLPKLEMPYSPTLGASLWPISIWARPPQRLHLVIIETAQMRVAERTRLKISSIALLDAMMI